MIKKLKQLKPFWFRYFLLMSFFIYGSCSKDDSIKTISHTNSFIPALTTDGWSVSSLESQNIDLDKITQVDNLLKNDVAYSNINSVTLVRHGKLVFDEFYYKGTENYKKGDIATLQSITKSFMSVVTGIAIDKGLINNVDQKVKTLLPNASGIDWSGQKAQISLKNILTMSAGFSGTEETDTKIVDNYIAYMFSKNLAYSPGTTFDYRTALTNTLNDILSPNIKSTSDNLDFFIKDNLLNPLQINNYNWAYKNDLGQIEVGGGLFLSPRDMIKLGQLVLNEGVWQGTQIVSANWLADATQTHFNFPQKYWGEMDGYGYLFWKKKITSNGKTYHSIIAIGYGGQYLVIIPSLDVVIGITSWFPNDINWQRPLRLIENYIIPAINN